MELDVRPEPHSLQLGSGLRSYLVHLVDTMMNSSASQTTVGDQLHCAA